MLENRDYCDYETCVALKELGFPIRRIKVKGIEKNVPILLYEAQKFLREEKDIDIQIMISDHNLRWYYVEIYRNGFCKTLKNGYAIKNFITYEKALLEGVREAVKILKEK